MAGLQFRKLDLHTHTPASKCYRYPEHSAGQLVAAAVAQGLDAIAVTDHNSAEWIDRMKEAAAAAGLVIFPGVEISLSEGFHLVALFDPATDQRQVENFLGAIDIQAEQYGRQDAICTRGVYEVIKKIGERNGLAVLAHIDDHKGAFYEQTSTTPSGQVRVPLNCSKLFNEASYHAVECRHGRLPDGFDSAHQFKRFPAVYQASDNPDPEKPTRHSLDGLAAQYSWFKMDHIDLEGLRQCFADPEVRIGAMSEQQGNSAAQIVSLHAGHQGFLKYQQLSFHSGLNSIIGGKGVGKSLAVELIRFALEQPPEDAALLQDHLSKLDKRLTDGACVEIIYRLSNGARYQISRTYEGHSRDGSASSHVTCTNLETGEIYRGDIAAMFPILAYSQTEVIKIAENKEAQLELIDRFIDKRPYEQTIAQAREHLRQNDVRLAAALDAHGRLSECDRAMQTIQAQIDNIDQTLSHPLFDQMKQMEAQRTAAAQQRQFITRLEEKATGWLAEMKAQPPEALPEGMQDNTFLQSHQALAQQAQAHAVDALTHLSHDLAATKAAATAQEQAWLPGFERVQAAYNKLLQESGGNQREQEKQRQRLENQKRDLAEEAGRYRTLAAHLKGLWQKRNDWLDQLEEAYRTYYQARLVKFRHLTEMSEGKLRLSLAHAADHQVYENRLVELLRGGVNAPQVQTRRQLATAVTPRRFIDLIVNRDAATLAQESDITMVWAERAIEKLWSHDNFAEVLAIQHDCYPADVPSIGFRKQGGQYAELSELSVGQKCTALLIIALCDGTLPVLIDQPEDALDIVSVWEDVAKKLRRGKNARQFILTTHNSSVAVAADSDQFIVLKARADAGRVVACGAIDRPDVRRAVIDHLEGGDEPYELRLRKYNIMVRL